MPTPSKPPNRHRTRAQGGTPSPSAGVAIQRATNWPLREIYATTVGIIGTVLAIPSFIHLSRLGMIVTCTTEVALLVAVFLLLSRELTRRRILLSLVCIALAIIIPLFSKRLFPAPNLYETATYNAFDYNGIKRTLIVETIGGGSCWEASVADSQRTDAYRCTAHNGIYDPCFFGGLGGSVICAGDPWTPRVTKLGLSAPLPVHMPWPNPEPAPWAVELSSGERCTSAPGTQPATAGQRLDYLCDLNGARLYKLDLAKGTADLETPDTPAILNRPIRRIWY
jgi:hypothetical protein